MKLQHTHRAVLDNKSGNKIVISANQLKGLKLQWEKKKLMPQKVEKE